MSTQNWQKGAQKCLSSLALTALLLTVWTPGTYAQEATMQNFTIEATDPVEINELILVDPIEIVDPSEFELVPTVPVEPIEPLDPLIIEDGEVLNLILPITIPETPEGEPFVPTFTLEATTGEPTTEPDTGSVSGTVWIDANGDGVRQPATEVGIAGVEVQLQHVIVDGGFAGITITDADGNYSFDNLIDGDIYYTSVILNDLADAYAFSHPINFGDDNFDSDVEAFTGYSIGSSDVFKFDANNVLSEKYIKVRVNPGGLVMEDGIPVVGGTTDTTTIDAGLTPLSIISGRVWLDDNIDALEDADTVAEPGSEDVMVRLYRVRVEGEINASGESIADQVVNVENVYTDTDGVYTFEKLPFGEYFVEIPEQIPAELLVTDQDPNNFPCVGLTAQNFGDDETIDSDFSALTTRTDNFSITTPGETIEDIDAGFVCSDVHGVVWDDLNNDGIRQNEIEPRIEGVFVVLYGFTDDWIGANIVGQTTTDAAGQYFFDDLEEGHTYVASFSLTRGGFSDNYTITRPMHFGDDRFDSDVEAYIGYSMGSSDAFEFTESSVDALTYKKRRVNPSGLLLEDGSPILDGTTNRHNIDAGFVKFASISGRVWADRDADGLQSDDTESENGLDDVLIRIYRAADTDPNNTNTPGQLINVKNIFTDENGFYTATKLVPGEFTVQFDETIPASLLKDELDDSNYPSDCSAVTLGNVGDDDTIDSDLDADSRHSESKQIDANIDIENMDIGLVCEPKEEETNTGGGSNGSGIRGNPGGGGSTPSTNNNPTFTGQSNTNTIVGTQCLSLQQDRDLVFTDDHSVAADILKNTAITTIGYNGETQYVVSGYNNSTYETGTATIGDDNNAYILEAAKMLITAGLCMPIQDARTLDVADFPDLPKNNPDDQWAADLFYTAKSIGLINGHKNMYAEYQRQLHSAEFVTLLVRAYELQNGPIDISSSLPMESLSPAAWYYPYYLKAAKAGLLKDELMQPHEILKRKTVFSLLVELLLEMDAYKPEFVNTVIEQQGLVN